MDEKRRKTIVGCILLLLAIGILILISFNLGPRCSLQEEEPAKLEPKNRLNVTSSDCKAIANFDAYLRYEIDPNKSKRAFLPLKLKSTSSEEPAKDTTIVRLGADCAEVVMRIKTDELQMKTIDKIDLILSVAYNKLESCTIESSRMIRYGEDRHYSCHKQQSYSCLASDKTKVASFVVRDLEFETLSKSSGEEISGDKFQTAPAQC